jgi:hypothetical protein
LQRLACPIIASLQGDGAEANDAPSLIFAFNNKEFSMKKSIMLVSVLAAFSMPFAARADQSGECALQRPFKVLNAHTGAYETNRVRGEHGWCNFSGEGIDNSVWTPEGGEASSSDTSGEGTSNSEAK